VDHRNESPNKELKVAIVTLPTLVRAACLKKSVRLIIITSTNKQPTLLRKWWLL